jgi:DNA-binding transcriptional ArsR family regulator
LATSNPEEALKELDDVFSALSHPARRQVLLFLQFRGGCMSAGDIAGRFQHAWPTTTRHLNVLESAGLLTHERQGRGRFYRLNTAKLDAVRKWLTWFETAPGGEQEGARDGGSDGREPQQMHRKKVKTHGSKRKQRGGKAH